MEEGEDDDFKRGLILPPLLVQLRKILEQYPDDTQILKELIQNAEDAGARTVKFLFDRHQFSRDSRRLQHAELAEFQCPLRISAALKGPALYAYNDGLLDEEDWTGIRMLSQSVKQDNPHKVGYFGMGFKSVFHLTDLPYILSGDRLGVIDPHERFFKNTTTFSWNFGKRRELLQQYRAHFEPFIGLFDCIQCQLEAGQYNGSIFRFPLRTRVSALSDKLYDAERIERLFEGFESDSQLLLLFLKSMERIQVLERGAYASTPNVVFEVRLAEDCVNYVRHKRREFITATQGREWKSEPVHSTYAVTIETIKHEKMHTVTKSYRYLVTNYFVGGHSSAIFRKLCVDPELHNSPCVGAAMPLDVENAGSGNTDDLLRGHVFCFLPLPVEQKSLTGLPVHLNGFFALEHNRKYVKWPSLYRTTMRDDLMDKRLLWNQCLLREALPRAYTALLLDAIHRHQDDPASMPLDLIYGAFPDFSSVDRRWEALMLPLFTELFKHPVICAGGAGGWVEVRQAVLDTLPENEVKSVILGVLEQGNIRVASVPQHVLDAVRRCYQHGFNRVTPALIAQTIKQHIQAPSSAVQVSFSLGGADKMKLLRYFMSDGRYELLDGLDMLPLANGGFTTFHLSARKADRAIFIATPTHPRSLLPGLDDDFLDPDLDADIHEMLCRAARLGYTQLRLLDAETVVELLPRVLPASWRDSPRVTWDPREYGQPEAGWLEELWLYLLRQHQTSLAKFEHLPIIPASTVERPGGGGKVIELVPLGKHSALICREYDGMILSQNIAAILRQLDVSVIDELPAYIKAHPLVTRKYTFTPTHIGVLRSLMSLRDLHGLEPLLLRLRALTPQETLSLRRMFSKISAHELRAEYRDFLRHIPLFQTVAGPETSEGARTMWVSVEECDTAAPKDFPALPLSRRLLDVTTSDAQALATILHVPQLTQLELFTAHVFPDIEHFYYTVPQVQTIMVYVLRHYHNFQSSHVSFRDTLRQLAFLPRRQELARPNRFYDPEHELLRKLFAGEDNFPQGAFAEPVVLAVLREIGLRGPSDVEPRDLLGAAMSVEEQAATASAHVQMLTSKADALLEFLVRHPSMLDEQCEEEPLRERMRAVRFVRAVASRPALYPISIPWYASPAAPSTKPLITSPDALTSQEYAAVVGSVMPVVAVETTNPVTYAFGWHTAPQLDKVVQHFANVIKHYSGKDKTLVGELVVQCYSVLAQHEPEMVQAALAAQGVGSEWLWTGDGFCAPQDALLESPFMDLSPYAHALPTALQPLAAWFSRCGVPRKCDLSRLLRLIQAKHNRRGASFTESEVRRDLHVCVSVLNELKTVLAGETAPADLVLPVHIASRRRLRLEPIAAVSFSDDEWLRQGHELPDLRDDLLAATPDGAAEGPERGAEEDELLLVHPNVPSATSEALGVPTLMSRMLDAEELDFSFGQSDSLTHRLSTLLQDYTDGFAVPKEMVQNADDAGATEVKFMYDERENEDAMTCLIDEGMRECQGPALWVYNDAVFSDEDFENICKLSGATKECQPDKIGRFGLGFNAVYNVTDVPSFVSRHSVVIFDPHTTHLGRSIRNKAKPGIRIDLRKHRSKLRRIGNQFVPYNDVFGCNLRPDAPPEAAGYNGTLFRLPLRTKAQAVRSEICAKHYDVSEVRSLLSLLVSRAETLLLFSQNVTRIALYHMPRGARGPQDMVQLYCADKKPVEVVRELLPKVECPVTAHKLSDDMKKMIQQSSVLRSAAHALRKLRQGASPQRTDLPSSSQVLEIEQAVSATLATRLEITGASRIRQWLVSSYMARGEALHMALKDPSLTPCAAIAVPVAKATTNSDSTANGDSYRPLPLLADSYPKSPAGQVFAYMPLAVATGLPVHINGALAISSSRRHLCERNEDDKFDMRALWNETLMRDGLCQAYLNILQDLSVIAPPSEFGYPEVWPNAKFSESTVRPLLEAFYKQLVTAKIPPTLFSDGSRWESMDRVRFLCAELEASSASATALRVARQCSRSSGEIVVYLPEYIRRGLHSAGHDRDINERTITITHFYEELFLPRIVNVNPIERDSLVLYALSMNDTNPHILALLKASRCIPVTPRGDILKCAHELIDPVSELAVLFTQEDQRFPYGVFQERNTLEVLRQLGLRSERLPWSDIVECTGTVSSVQLATAQKRIPVLLKQIERHIQSCDSDSEIKDNVAQLVNVPFLLAQRKPDYFPWAWGGDSATGGGVLAPNQLQHPSHADVICLVEPVLDTACVPPECQTAVDCLNMAANMSGEQPNVESVLAQLEILADTENEACLADKRIFKDVHRICSAVYELLQYRCEQPAIREKIVKRLSDRPIFLCHGRFLYARQMAFGCTQNLPPYLYSVPDTFCKNYERFLRVMGVRDNFEAHDYVIALQDMRGLDLDSVLGREPLKLALQLVNLLNDAMTESNQSMAELTHEHGTIYIPDAAGVLRPSHELCFNEPDCAWVPGATTAYSHPLIPFAISRQLGVNTRRHDMLSRHSTGIAFGQKERLTNRIRRLLSAYPCDKEILKELLQNADDAGATEITFINDPRAHPADRVFDDSWKPLQGPALLVYNDAAFGEKDISGIQRLGEGSKALDPNSTGQYGVGFTCVYHLTDAPSFLTAGGLEQGSQTLCVFDPHAKYVPGATSSEPGRRFNDVGRIRDIFSDVFPCYLEKHFPLQKGTMFRFPLRTPEMAESSELSNKHMTSKDVNVLFTKFRTEMFDCLMFVNHVSSITLCDVDPKTGAPTNSYTVCADLSEQDHVLRKEFSSYIAHITAKMRSGQLQAGDVPPKEVTYTLNLTDSNGYYEKWLVHQRVGFEKGVELSPTLSECCKRAELSLLPRGGAAALLERDEHDPVQPARPCRAYCFLPLPLRTGLPLSVNGHFALDHEARRSLWSDDLLDRSAKGEWNELLLKHVVAPAYVNTLLAARGMLGGRPAIHESNASIVEQDNEEVTGIERYLQLFPTLANSDHYVTTLVKGVYSHMHASGAKLLPMVRTRGRAFSDLSLSLEGTGQAEVLWLSTRGTHTPYFDTEADENAESGELSLSLNESSGGLATRRHLTQAANTPLTSTPLPASSIAARRQAILHATTPPRSGRPPTSPTPSRGRIQSASTPGRGLPQSPARLNSSFVTSQTQGVKQALIACGLKLVCLPSALFDCLVASGVPAERISPRAVVDFFASHGQPGNDCSLGSSGLPLHIRSTQLSDEQTLASLLQYCQREREHFLSHLPGLPLLLTADGQLREFSTESPVYLTEHTYLLPDCASEFVHGALWRALSGLNPDDHAVFRRFDVPAFAALLPNMLREPWYRKESEHAQWIIEGDELPTQDWIWQVWAFLRSEYERVLEQQGEGVVHEDVVRGVLKPLSEWCLLPAHLNDPKTPATPASARSSFSSWSDAGLAARGTQYLVPLGLAHTVLDLSATSVVNMASRGALRQLGLPELSARLLDGGAISPHYSGASGGNTSGSSLGASNSSLARALVATLERPVALLQALVWARECERLTGLTGEQATALLKYFTSCVDAWRTQKECALMLRELPVFLSVRQKLEAINGKTAYVLPPDVPHTDLEMWEKEGNVIFLRRNPTIDNLYEAIGCVTLTATQVYSQFTFQNFDRLSDVGRIKHLEFIRDIKLPQLKGDERKVFLDNLIDLRFLQDPLGKFRKACDFYDPYNPVFKAIFGKDSALFPPKPFNEFKWLEFLKLVGLNYSVSADQFVKFAREVAEEAVARPGGEETFNKARMLVVHLLQRPQVANEGILERLVDIPFIPAARVNPTHTRLSPTYAQLCGDVEPYMTFKDGVPEVHEPLVWTCAFLLPDWANPYKLTANEVSWEYEEDPNLAHFRCYRQRVAQLLGVVEEPRVADVVAHAKNLVASASRAAHPSSSGGGGGTGGQGDAGQDADVKAFMRMEVMKMIYKFLQEKALGSDAARQALEGHNFLLVDLGYTFVRTEQVFPDYMNSDKAICTFMSVMLILFVDLAYTFARTEQVVIELYEDDQIPPFLYKLPTELGEFRRLFVYLGATEQATPRQYANVLATLFENTHGAKLHPNEMRTAFKAVNELFKALQRRQGAAMADIDILYLPSQSGCLLPSNDLAFNNCPAFSERIKPRHFDRPFLVDLAECQLSSKTGSFEDVIRLLPRRLRPPKLTALVSERLEEISAKSVMGYGLCEKIKHQLTSRAFSQGVLRLVKHEHQRAGLRVKKEVFDAITNTLKRVRVYGVQTLITYLSYDEERILDSESQCECFAEKSAAEDALQLGGEEGIGEAWCIYIDNCASLNEEFLVTLAEVVNRILGGLLDHSIHYLQPTLSCAPHAVHRVLDKLKVRPDHSVDFRQPTLPTPGSFVPIEDHHLLNEDFNEFEVGEYVAYEIDDDGSLESGAQTFVYAVIVEVLVEESEDHSHRGSIGGSTSRDRVFLSQKYTINIGDERKPVEAMATDLYKFHRVEGFVSQSSGSGATPRSNERTRTYSDTAQSPSGSYRDSFASFSEGLYEPQTPRTPKTPGVPPQRRGQQPDEVFVTPPPPKAKISARRGRGGATPGQGAVGEEEEEVTVRVKQDGSAAFGEPELEQEDTPGRRTRRGHTRRYKPALQLKEETTPGGGEDTLLCDSNVADSFSYYERFFGRQQRTTEEGEEFVEEREAFGEQEEMYVDGERYEQKYEPAQEGEAQEGVEANQQQQEQTPKERPPPGSQLPEPGSSEDKTPEEVLNEVSDCLEEAWTLPEGQRKKIIKRLLLKWHPDKNIGNEQFSTMITQHIGSEIERLELGLPRPDKFEDILNQFNFDPRNPFSRSETFQKNFYSAYQFFFDQVNQRAKEHKQQRERYKEFFAREYSSSRARDFDNFDVPPSFSSANPQPNQAKRFLRQAQEDLRAADNDYDVTLPAYEWTCFKAHQAAEKALKAAQFAVDASTSFSHDLAVLAASIEDLELRRLAVKLQQIIGNASKLYNPDPIDFVIIPHEEFTKEMACDAQMCAADILERVKEFVELRD